MSSEADMPVMSVTLDDADIEWVQRRALHHLQLVNERTAEVRWKEFGYYGTFLLALLAAFWFRRGWIVNWLTTILLAIVLGMAWPSDANAQESSSTKSEAPNSKQNQLPISKSEAPNLKEAQDPVSDLVLRVSNLTPQFGAWFLDISEVSNLGFGVWVLDFLQGLFLTSDQQGRWYFDLGDYATAAGRFTDPMWKGLASYRSGDYATALTQFARLDTPEAFFLMRNCDARMKEFPAAVGAYDHALKGRPAFREAIENRALVASLIPKKPHDDEGEDAPNLDPDDIKFDKKGKHGALPQLKVKPEEMAELWMRNLKVSPADFLREKFPGAGREVEASTKGP